MSKRLYIFRFSAEFKNLAERHCGMDVANQLEAYYTFGVRPSPYIEAILENNLLAAVSLFRYDGVDSFDHFRNIVSFIWNKCPGPVFCQMGSTGRVARTIALWDQHRRNGDVPHDIETWKVTEYED